MLSSTDALQKTDIESLKNHQEIIHGDIFNSIHIELYLMKLKCQIKKRLSRNTTLFPIGKHWFHDK